MKVTEDCIDHNVARLVSDIAITVYECEKPEDALM